MSAQAPAVYPPLADRSATATRLRAFVTLTKPGITVFIGGSAAAGWLLGSLSAGAVRSPAAVVAATLLLSAGAAALNHVAERDSDARMTRTAARPLPAGVLSTATAAAFGWLLAAAGTALSLALLTPLATALLVLSFISYVHIYTPLKRRTPLCTLAGAVPGALPVLAGAAAAGQAFAPAPVALAAVLFTWQIPHFLSIAWIARDDYARAGCPMLGVIDPSGRSSAEVSLLYTLLMVLCAVIVGITAPLGPAFGLALCAAGGAYVASALRFLRAPARDAARRLFFVSLAVLPALLAGLAADVLLL